MRKKVLFVLPILFFFQINSALAIPGFKEYRVRPGDTLFKIFKKELSGFNQEILDLTLKINKIDAWHLISGITIYLPYDIGLARAYCPLPKTCKLLNKHPRGIFLNLTTQYFGAYEYGKLKFWGPISSGRKGKETPIGNFKAIFKKKNRISIKYGVPMLYSIQFSGHYFMHQQSMLGRPASHGCVRLLLKDAKKLFYWINKGDPIIIRNNTLAIQISEGFLFNYCTI